MASKPSDRDPNLWRLRFNRVLLGRALCASDEICQLRTRGNGSNSSTIEANLLSDESMPRAKKVQPAQLIDRRYLDEMEKSGFFDNLWGGKR